jgi:NADH-quinone oxidoreductase subunit H
MTNITWIVLETAAKAGFLVLFIQLMAATNVYLERKISAFIQNRIGPNRVGPWGVLQPFADVIKLFFKEDIVPKNADRLFHRLAPMISLGVAIAVWAVIPFGDYIEVMGNKVYMGVSADVNIGLLFILAMTSVGVYGITLAGWSSNNKYSLLGGLRSAAQMISYELSMGLAVIGVVLISGSLSLYDIVGDQQSWGGWRWNVFLQPLGLLSS